MNYLRNKNKQGKLDKLNNSRCLEQFLKEVLLLSIAAMPLPKKNMLLQKYNTHLEKLLQNPKSIVKIHILKFKTKPIKDYWND